MKFIYKVCAIFIVLISILFAISLQQIQQTPYNPKITQLEIKNEGNLLNDQGQLVDIGYSRKPLKNLNLENISPPLGLPFLTKLRLKQWEFYQFVLPKELILSVTVADLGYSGNLALHIYEIQKNKFTHIEQILMPHEIPNLPKTTDKLRGKISVKTSKLSVNFHAFEYDKNNSRINVKIDCPYLNVSAEYHLIQPNDDDQIVMMTPINNETTNFYYNIKSYNMKVEGYVKTNETTYKLKKAQAGRDWGRGVWNYNTYWLWMTGQGYLNTGEKFGINLGRGFEAAGKATAYEDSVFIKGKMIKLNSVLYNIPSTKYANLTFQTETINTPGSIQGTFQPLNYFLKNHNFIVLKSQIEQCYGIYSGWLIDDNKQNITFSEIYGNYEINQALW